MKFIGLKFVEGYKCYNNPFRRMKNHPTLIFFDEKSNNYYFINFSSTKEMLLRDTLRKNGKSLIFIARNVRRGRMLLNEYQMNVMVSIAKCHEDYVNTLEKPAKKGCININNSYKCSNYELLVRNAFRNLYEYKSQIFIYNGNDDDYQSPDLEDASIPNDLLTIFKTY